MDPRLRDYYERELQHLRGMGTEFARQFPKVAGRLALESIPCADPYVERLLEGVAFLTARVQLKLDAQYPQFTQHLLEMIYPHYVAPTPSMTVVQMEPNLEESGLAQGFLVPRGTTLRSHIGEGEQTACRYQTAHDVLLWPLQVTRAEYFSRDEALRDAPALGGAQAGLRLRLACTAGLTFDKLALERLPIFLTGAEKLPTALYEQMLANTIALVVRPAAAPAPWQAMIGPRSIRRVGFRDDEAMLPFGPRSFTGYRLLHEYFAIPERFLFLELGDLGPSVRRCQGRELEIFILFDRLNRALEHRVDASMVGLFCTPAINLFAMRADRIHLDNRRPEFQVIPDRTRPLDYEVHQVTEVVGYGDRDQQGRVFAPFYTSFERSAGSGHTAGNGERPGYYTVHRTHRVLSEKQRRLGPRAPYIGSDLYVSLVDPEEVPYDGDLRQLAVATLCTNRDLPLLMPVGVGSSDFTLEASTPVVSVRCLVGPTQPRPPLYYGKRETEAGHETVQVAWRLISHLSLNYASLSDDAQQGGAVALREILSLYADLAEPHVRKQIDGVRSAVARPITRPIPTDGPLTFARGLEIDLTMDESSFAGIGVFLLGTVLEEFLARYVSTNSFTETVLRTGERGEVMRWPARIGRRQIL